MYGEEAVVGVVFMFELSNTHREKLYFTQSTTKMFWNKTLAPPDLFHMFTQPIFKKKLYTFHYHILKSTDVWKRWFTNYAENKWLFLSTSFTAKFELVFVLAQENAFPLRFHFEANRKSIGASKELY